MSAFFKRQIENSSDVTLTNEQKVSIKSDCMKQRVDIAIVALFPYVHVDEIINYINIEYFYIFHNIYI